MMQQLNTFTVNTLPMYALLVKSNFGTVHYCRKSHNIRIDYLECPMVLPYDHFAHLKASAEVYLRANKAIKDKESKLIRLLMFAGAMMLTYSYHELRRLVVLLNAAYEKLNNDLLFVTMQRK